MAATSLRMITKSSSSAALNLLNKSKPIQLHLRTLPLIDSSASRFKLCNQKSDLENKTPTYQLQVWIKKPQSITDKMLMGSYSGKYPDVKDYDDYKDEIDDDMIDEEDDDDVDDDDDEFEDEEDEFVKSKVRTRSDRDF